MRSVSAVTARLLVAFLIFVMLLAGACAPADKPALYDDLAREIDALLTGEPDPTANAANAAAAIYHSLGRLNWAGFYFLRGEEPYKYRWGAAPRCTSTCSRSSAPSAPAITSRCGRSR